MHLITEFQNRLLCGNESDKTENLIFSVILSNVFQLFFYPLPITNRKLESKKTEGNKENLKKE